MNLRHISVIVASALLTQMAAGELSDAERFHRLNRAPITLYPETALPNSPVVAFFNQHARSDDAIVCSYVDALKTSARIKDIGVTRGEVWIYVPRDLDLTQNGRPHVEGAQGLVYVPDDTLRTKGSLSTQARQVAERAATLGFRMAAGLEPGLARSLANVADVAKHASILTIYDSQKLRNPAGYRAYVQRLVKEARAANPTILIEVAISTGADEKASKALAGTLWNCADLIDRIGIYCNDTAASQASLALYFEVLRRG
jgi:hypothetical protein